MFIQEHAKFLATSKSGPTLTPSNLVPKQYGGVSQTHHANETYVEPTDAVKVANASNTSSDEKTVKSDWKLACVLQSHKATRNAACFLGMTTSVPNTPSDCTVCVNVDPSKLHSLVSRLSPWELVIVADGGCDTGLLQTDWYVLVHRSMYQHGWI